jgi:ABC-type glycerol-3-phosphate transport system substrate-binding protein
MSTFKIALTSIFGISIVLGILFFSLARGKSAGQVSNILIWGTINAETFDYAYKNSSLKDNKQITVRYVKKDPLTFDTDFVEALADAKAPDLVILRDDLFYKNRNRFFTIPYANYTERAYRDTFIDAGRVFLTSEGAVALPFIIDPLVMYWNRDMFTANQIVNPPRYWDDIYTVINKITRKDASANVTRSALSFGEWRNVNNAKEILVTLLLQAGTPIVVRDKAVTYSVLNNQYNYPVAPSVSAVNFYTQFSNPTSPRYTWNRSLPTSLNFFLSGDLATYFGFASEIFSIQQKNANLNFDVALVPQVKDSEKKAVFGRLYGIAIVKQSKQLTGAYLTAVELTGPSAISALGTATNLPPVRRDLLANRPTDAFRSVFYDSALYAQSWVDPDGVKTSNVFRDMIESITSGKSRVSDALGIADSGIMELLK